MATEINRASIEELMQGDLASNVYRNLMTLYDYCDQVMRMEDQVAMAKVMAADVEDYQTQVTAIDRRRKLQHDSAIASLSVLNRIAARQGVEPVISMPVEAMDGDEAYEQHNRVEIASAILRYCEENIQNDRNYRA